MISRRGRPRTTEHKTVVTSLRLSDDDKATLEVMARNSNKTLYRFVESAILDMIQDYRDEVDRDYNEEPEHYVYVNDDGEVVEDDDWREAFY